MTQWKNLLRGSIASYEELQGHFGNGLDPRIRQVIAQFPMRINPYFLELIKKSGSPLVLQAVPDAAELADTTGIPDPLNEENLSPVPNLVHRYPDRVLFLVSAECAVYCRFCTRKRKVGTPVMRITDDTIKSGLHYIKENPTIKEVLLSGGDPLILEDERVDWLLAELKRIRSVEIIRIGSRVPCTLPMRITDKLCQILKKYHPLYINTHFNHPLEITKEAKKACGKLCDSGIPLGNQTVLLKGINDSPQTMVRLNRLLLQIRVKPYYLFQADLTKGTDHFRTSTKCGIGIMRSLIGNLSGMAVPTYALDAPGGYGKIPLTPDYVTKKGSVLEFSNYAGKSCSYPEAL